MADIKDILGLPGASSDGTLGAEKPSKKAKTKLSKPKGMSREAYSLLTETHPLMPSQLMGEIEAEEGKKKDVGKKKFRGKISYEWRPFANPSRKDDLQLHHWVKCYTNTANNTKTIPAEQDGYPFAKYNKRPNVLKYNDEEWRSLIETDTDWTKAETDYLLQLVETLDMRWFAIADRYEYIDDKGNQKERSVDDIKGRYYSVARQLMIGREGGTAAIANHVLIKHPFDAQHEKRRKAGLELYLLRTHDQEAEEDVILQQAAKIEAKRKAEDGKDGLKGTVGAPNNNARMQELIEISEFTNTPPVGTLPLFDGSVQPTSPADGSRVIVRRRNVRDIVEAKMISLSEKQKDVMGRLLEGLKLTDPPRTCTRAISEAYLTLINEGLEYIELRKNVEAKQLMKKRMRSQQGDVSMENMTSLKQHRFAL
jgi:DNA methyltransferase 1-associated protein 1